MKFIREGRRLREAEQHAELRKGQGHSWKALFVALRLQRFVIFLHPQDNLGGRGVNGGVCGSGGTESEWEPSSEFQAGCLSLKDSMFIRQLLRLGGILSLLSFMYEAVFLSGLKIKS